MPRLFILYGAKPDGPNMPHNDNDWPFTGWWEREALLTLRRRVR